MDLSCKTVLSDSINGFTFQTGLSGSGPDNKKKKKKILNIKDSQIVLYHSHNVIHTDKRPL